MMRSVMVSRKWWGACLAAAMSTGVLAQAQLDWSARLDGGDSDDDLAFQQVVFDDGSVAVTGYSWADATAYDLFTARWDGRGRLLWQRRFDGGFGEDDFAYNLAADAAGNLFVFGSTSGGPGGRNLTVLKYDSDGALLWDRHYDGPAQSVEYPGNPNAIAVDESGSVYVTGQSVGLSGYFEFVTLKYDADGNLDWQRRYAGAGGDNAGGWGLVRSGSGRIFVAGDAPNENGNTDITVLQYDADGNLLWARQYDGPGASTDSLYNIAGDDFGNVYVCGITYAAGSNYDYVTVKYDGGGALQWAAQYDFGLGVDYGFALAVDAQQNVYVTGESMTSGGEYDIATVRYRADGTQDWVQRYTDPTWFGEDGGSSVVVDAGGSAYVVGYSWRGWSRAKDAVLLRYEPDGTLSLEHLFDGPPGGEDAYFAVDLGPGEDIYACGTSLGARTRADYVINRFQSDACTGGERIAQARCRNRNGSDQLKVKLAGGLPGDTFAVELSTGERLEGTLKPSGKAKVKFNDLNGGPGEATATWGCGGATVQEYQCP